MTDLNEIYIRQTEKELYDQIKALQEKVLLLEDRIKSLTPFCGCNHSQPDEVKQALVSD